MDISNEKRGLRGKLERLEQDWRIFKCLIEIFVLLVIFSATIYILYETIKIKNKIENVEEEIQKILGNVVNKVKGIF